MELNKLFIFSKNTDAFAAQRGYNYQTLKTLETWNSSLSAKYDKKFSLEAIENRFNNVQKCTYITLADLKKNPDFPAWLNSLRSQGFKDWQILINMQNFMVNYKVQQFERKRFDTEQGYVEHLQKAFHKYVNM